MRCGACWKRCCPPAEQAPLLPKFFRTAGRLSIIPSTIVEAFAKGATLQFILISVLTGVAMVHRGERRKPRSAGLSLNPCATVHDEAALREPSKRGGFLLVHFMRCWLRVNDRFAP
jgi:hypothetical protein